METSAYEVLQWAGVGIKYRNIKRKHPILGCLLKECIDHDVLKEVLTKHRREVVDMCLTEFDEEKYGEILREEGREGGRILQLIDLVKDGILDEDTAQQRCGLSKEGLKKRLYQKVE